MIAVRAYTIADIRNMITLQLEGDFSLSPRVEAERIIEEVTGLSRAELYINRGRTLTAREIESIEALVGSRLTGKPLQYVLGHQQFRYLDIRCREGVLVPRPETELLVDAVLSELKLLSNPVTVLDIGCGTGAIALSIANEHVESVVYAVDISPAALELTKENARVHNLLNRVKILKSDVFDALEDMKNRFDVIVSNPPYIPSGELAKLQREVQFEPRLALDGGEDGLNFYRLIIEQSPAYIKSGGSIFFEIGIHQAPEVKKLIEATASFTDIGLIKDYQGIDRIIRARRA